MHFHDITVTQLPPVYTHRMSYRDMVRTGSRTAVDVWIYTATTWKNIVSNYSLYILNILCLNILQYDLYIYVHNTMENLHILSKYDWY
jgi:hypothetical protein